MSSKMDPTSSSDASPETKASKPGGMTLEGVILQILFGALGSVLLTWLLTFLWLKINLGNFNCNIDIDKLDITGITACRESLTGFAETVLGNLGPTLGAALGIFFYARTAKQRGSLLFSFLLPLVIFALSELLTGTSAIYPRGMMFDLVNLVLSIQVLKPALIAAIAGYLGFMIPNPFAKKR
ncbi:hypothetical protein HYR53_10680 [Candidatus Acetothermia bacterium]|nr:hypothetical protein [Candidatus Acetothermia bacterium]